MDINLAGKKIIVCGATSGFGKSIAELLITEKAQVIAIARDNTKLDELYKDQPDVETLSINLEDSDSAGMIINKIKNSGIDGIVVNAGGPPAKSFKETSIEDWDNAYHKVVRWKVDLVNQLLPLFEKKKYGRIVFIESATVKQPIDNMMLSSSLRLAIVGYSKSIAKEFASKGITSNVMAPGFHLTPAIERVFKAKSKSAGISYKEAEQSFVDTIDVKKIGDPEEFAKMGLFLLSPASSYMTGLTINIDGGINNSIFG